MRNIILSMLIQCCFVANLQNAYVGNPPHAEAFLDVDYDGIIALYDKPNGNVIRYLKNEEENILIFRIEAKKGDMFLVTIIEPENLASDRHGWIYIGEHIGIYSRAYTVPLKLYAEPNDASKIQSIIEEYDPGLYTVIDCKNDWLKVRRVLHGKIHVGWMAPEMQCPNPYSTCS